MRLEDIKGIGLKTVSLFNKIGISNLEDLVTYYPFRYNIIKKTNINESLNGDNVVIDGIIETVPSYYRIRKGLDKLSFKFKTDDYLVNIIIFNRGYLRNYIKAGNKVCVIGKYDKVHNMVSASEIRFSLIGDKLIIEPVYHLTYGLSSKSLQKYIALALSNPFDSTSYVPNYLIERYKFIEKEKALKIIHNPNDVQELKGAINHLKYEELFLFMLKMEYLKNNKSFKIGVNRNIDKVLAPSSQ